MRRGRRVRLAGDRESGSIDDGRTSPRHWQTARGVTLTARPMLKRSSLSPLRRLAFSLTLLAALPACSRQAPAPAPATDRHGHSAPHGGTLVELGEHRFNLEFVRDAAAGKLTAYVLDAHAENFVRIKTTEMELIATVGADKRTLKLVAVANAATGETVGDTSQFETQADWLKTTEAFDAVVSVLWVGGTEFNQIKFHFSGGR